MPQFEFRGNIGTDPNGIQQIANFYSTCKSFKNCSVNLLFNNVIFFDANLSSLLLCLGRELISTNNLKFFVDYKIFNATSLGVLKRNGLAKQLCNLPGEVYDNRESVIRVKSFEVEDADNFVNYIERELLKHRGLENISYDKKKMLKSSYYEIFDNVGIHANTTSPIWACGQYYPQLRELKFTLVDLGDGFLKKISIYTAETENPITTGAKAISWAVQGGSTKTNAEGGNGLKKILLYCKEKGGSLHIYSDGIYWRFEGAVNSQVIRNPFEGATLTLIFRNL